MKPFSWFAIISYLGIIGYQIVMAPRYLNITVDTCYDQAFVYSVIPVPGAMNGLSWVAMLSWLFLALFFSLSVGSFSRKSFFISTLLLCVTFGFLLVRADMDCGQIVNCGTKLQASVDRTIDKAISELDEATCLEMTALLNKCKSQLTSDEQTRCQQTVSTLKRYRDAGLDIDKCSKERSGCRVTMLQFYAENLSDDLETARYQCEHNFGKAQASKDLCLEYIQLWQIDGHKPVQ